MGNTLAALALDAIATVTLPKLREGDVEGAKSLYCSLWYHPRCGGRPEAYESSDIICSDCSYRYRCQPSEPLGLSLNRSEFLTKKGNPAWFV